MPLTLLAHVCLTLAAGGVTTAEADPARQLALDSRLFQSIENARLAIGQITKDPGNPLMRVDKPWENSLNNLYPSVAYDPARRKFELWYKCVLVDPDAIAKMQNITPIHQVGWISLYASSVDGLRWDKPVLGLHPYAGSAANNIATIDTAGFGVMRDPDDPDPQRRYKMVYDVEFDEMRVRFSQDGIHWTPAITPEGLHLKQLGGQTGDTHSNAFWDPRGRRYVLITRDYRGERLVARSESRDFLHWKTPEVVLRSTPEEAKNHQTYCMTAFPYGNVYLGLVMMYHVGKDRSVDCELAWSPDTLRWQRVAPGRPLIAVGPPKSYDAGCVYAQAGPPVWDGDRVVVYYGGSEATHRGWKRHCLLCRATLRKDGFAGYEPIDADRRAVLVTQPLRATGQPICVNADIRGGSLAAVLLDEQGKTLGTSRPITADATDLPLGWTRQVDAAGLKGKPIRLRFELDRACLYSITGVELP